MGIQEFEGWLLTFYLNEGTLSTLVRIYVDNILVHGKKKYQRELTRIFALQN